MPKPTIMNPGHNSNMQTPIWALEPLLPFIPSEWTIWEPAAGEGNLVKGMRDYGLHVISTDISRGDDFFSLTPPRTPKSRYLYSATITNPPYDEKDRWIGHCYYLGKPFALLLPFAALETHFRQAMYRESGLQIIFFDKRVNFKVPSGKNSPWFPVAWFTWQFNLPKDMMFMEIAPEPKERFKWIQA